MPYIKLEERVPLDYLIDSLAAKIKSVGQMNYVITRLIHKFFGLKDNCSYGKINDAVGVLECAKLELYSQIARPYEDEKIKENGNV